MEKVKMQDPTTEEGNILYYGQVGNFIVKFEKKEDCQGVYGQITTYDVNDNMRQRTCSKRFDAPAKLQYITFIGGSIRACYKDYVFKLYGDDCNNLILQYARGVVCSESDAMFTYVKLIENSNSTNALQICYGNCYETYACTSESYSSFIGWNPTTSASLDALYNQTLLATVDGKRYAYEFDVSLKSSSKGFKVIQQLEIPVFSNLLLRRTMNNSLFTFVSYEPNTTNILTYVAKATSSGWDTSIAMSNYDFLLDYPDYKIVRVDFLYRFFTDDPFKTILQFTLKKENCDSADYVSGLFDPTTNILLFSTKSEGVKGNYLFDISFIDEIHAFAFILTGTEVNKICPFNFFSGVAPECTLYCNENQYIGSELGNQCVNGQMLNGTTKYLTSSTAVGGKTYLTESCPLFFQDTQGNKQCSICSIYEFYLNGKCLSACPSGDNGFNTTSDRICRECFNSAYKINEDKCVDLCPFGKQEKSGKCLKCKEIKEIEGNYFVDQGICSDSCVEYNEDTSLCYKCNILEVWDGNKCITGDCTNSFLYERRCLKSCSSFGLYTLYLDDEKTYGECFDQCPSDTELKDKECIFTDKAKLCKRKGLFYDSEMKDCVETCRQYQAPNSQTNICENICTGNKTKYFEQQCYESCPIFTKEDSNTYTCSRICTIAEIPYFFENQCLSKCPIFTKEDSNTYTCSRICTATESPYFFENKCFESCPIFTKEDSKNYTCSKICTTTESPYFFENQCLSECPIFTEKDSEFSDSLCKLKCTETDLSLFYNDQCVNKCPETAKASTQYPKYLCENKCDSTKPYYFLGLCYAECPLFTILNTVTNTCTLLCDPLTTKFFEGKCVDSCPEYAMPDTLFGNYACIRQCSLLEIYYNGTCYSSCPLLTEPDTSGYFCKKICSDSSLPFLYENKCYSECPSLTEPDPNYPNELCRKCPSELPYYNDKLKICQSECSEEGYELKDNICFNCELNGMLYNNVLHKCYKDECPEGYTYNKEKETCEQICYESCETCIKLGDSVDHKCKICKEGFFKKYDNEYNCYKGDLEGYFLDEEKGRYYECYESCKFCEGYKTDDHHNCLVCKDDLIKEDSSGINGVFNCVKKGHLVDNLYLYNLNLNSTEFDQHLSGNDTANEEFINNQLELLKSENMTELDNSSKIEIYNKISNMNYYTMKANITETNDLVAESLKVINTLSGNVEEYPEPENADELGARLLATYFTTGNINSDTRKDSKMNLYKLIEKNIIQSADIIDGIKSESEDDLSKQQAENHKIDLLSIQTNTMNNILNVRAVDNTYSTQITDSDKLNVGSSIRKSLVLTEETKLLKKAMETFSEENQIMMKTKDTFTAKSEYVTVNTIKLKEEVFKKGKDNSINFEDFLLVSMRKGRNMTKDRDLNQEIKRMRQRKVNVSLLIPDLEDEEEEHRLSFITYKKYPLLHPSCDAISQSVYSIKIFKGENNEEINQFKKGNEIQMVIKKPYQSFNECIFFDDSLDHWNNTGCTSYSSKLYEDYLVCSCNHLTDFSLSTFSIDLAYDIYNLLKDVRVMDSFAPFKDLSWESSKVFFVYALLAIILGLGLIITLFYDLGKNRKDGFFIKKEEKDFNCCSREETLSKLDEIKKKTNEKILEKKKEIYIKKKLSKDYSNSKETKDNHIQLNNEEDSDSDDEPKMEIEMTEQHPENKSNETTRRLSKDFSANKENFIEEDKKDFELNSNGNVSFYSNKRETKKKQQKEMQRIRHEIKRIELPCQWYYREKYLFESFFCEEYRFFVIFSSKENEITKTNILILIIIRFAAQLAICSLLSPCNSKENVQTKIDRDLVVAIITILLIEIPFTFFELSLTKATYTDKNRHKYREIKGKRMGLQFVCYILLGIIFVLSWLNTTWISITKYTAGQECSYLNEFLLSSLLDNFVYEILILFSKSLIYYILIRRKSAIMSCYGKFFLCLLVSLPWVFALKG
ncbi:MAG: hypothetical protein MJ252_05155 [archaeon]|nr:hypothetical protein [archaeon]